MNASVDVLFVNSSLDETVALLRELRRVDRGIRATRVASAEALVEALRRQHWDLIITEFTMPQFGALEAIRRVKSEGLDIPVIVVSSQGGEEAALEVMRAGAKDFLRRENLGRLAPVAARELAQGRLRRERRQIGLAFRAVEQRLHAIVANSPDAILMVSEEGLIVFANAAVRTTFGYTVAELLGQPVHMLMPFAAGQAQWQTIRSCPKKSSVPFEITGKHKEGREIALETSCSELREGNKRFLVAIFRDVTERKRSQQALAEAETKYRTLVEESLFGVYLIQDGRFVYVNPQMTVIFGYSREELLALPSLLETVSPRHREMVRLNLEKRLTGEARTLQYTFQGLRKDGQEIEIAVRGSTILYEGKPALIGSLYEIPERRWRGTYQPGAETASFDRK